MILVSVGTNEARFDRLLDAVAGLRSGEPILVQHGPSPVRPPNAECVDFLPFEALVDAIGRSRVVVVHAGVGSIMVALSAGRRPIVVPRLARYDEAVDDHQLPLARRLAAAGLVTLVEDPAAGLQAAVDRAETVPAVAIESTSLARDLRAYLLANCRESG